MQKDNIIFYVQKEKNFPSRILYPVKVPFKCRSIMKRLQNDGHTEAFSENTWKKSGGKRAAATH